VTIAHSGVGSWPNRLHASERFLYNSVERCAMYIDGVPAIG
jgi:hypothetical protein